MANSVTLNVILSNFMVDLAYALDCLGNPLYGGTKDSYFRLVRGLDVTNPNLDDQTQLILDVSDGNGSFKTRNLVLDLKEIWNQNPGVIGFKNLDAIWYCLKVVDGSASISIVEEMNNFYKKPNPFGMNPFDANLVNSDYMGTFNDWLGSQPAPTNSNFIVENKFLRTVIKDENANGNPCRFGEIISRCRYLFCISNGFYGLESNWNEIDGSFSGFTLHNIGSMLPILKKKFDFKFCSFHVLGDAEETTLFLTMQEKGDGGQYRYLYLNESSIDETYGFTEVDSVVVDQLVVSPSNVFNKVDSIRELDNVNIAMTNYGFWDIEANNTNNVVQSYKNGKEYIDGISYVNKDMKKLVTPTMDFSPETD